MNTLYDNELQSLAENIVKHLDAVPESDTEQRVAITKDILFLTLEHRKSDDSEETK